MNNPVLKLKPLACLLLWAAAVPFCWGQKYEVWVEAEGEPYRYRLNLKSFNDSILTVAQKPSIFNLFKPEDFNYKWETVYGLKIRNQTVHTAGLIIGTGIGIIAAGFIVNSVLDNNEDNPVAAIILVGPAAFAGCGAGMLAGHLITSAKIVIPMGEKDAKGKSEALRGRIRK